MGFVIYKFPGSSIDAIEASLKDAGFDAQILSSKRSGKAFVQVRKGLSRTMVIDYTEKCDVNVHFNIVGGRPGLLSTLLFAPIDARLIRQVERHLINSGARLVDFNEIPNR